MNIRDFCPVNLKCAIFDLDGTLLNSTGVWAKVDIDFLAKRGIPVPQDYMDTIKTHNFQTGSVYTVQRFNLNEKPEDIAQEWYEMAAFAYAYEIDLKSGATEFLHALKNAGIKIAAATSSDRSLYEPCLKRNGVYELFDNFTQTDEVERGKGYPDVYEKAAEKCGVSVSECIVFEDILRAVQGAADGGFCIVGVYDEASAQDTDKIRKIANLYIEDYNGLSV